MFASIFRHLKLELLAPFPASNDEKIVLFMENKHLKLNVCSQYLNVASVQRSTQHCTNTVNPQSPKLNNLNFHPLEVEHVVSDRLSNLFQLQDYK